MNILGNGIAVQQCDSCIMSDVCIFMDLSDQQSEFCSWWQFLQFNLQNGVPTLVVLIGKIAIVTDSVGLCQYLVLQKSGIPSGPQMPVSESM